MVKQLTKTEKVLFALLGLSVAIIVLGILFLLNAMQDMENPDNIAFFTAFSQIDNVLAKYIVVILTMSAGIMLFSNVALRFPNKKLRNGLTIGITTFAFVLTLPLVYVFIAILPLAAKATTTGMPAFDELFVVDQVMRTDNIFKGFMAWFGNGAFLWVVLVFMLLLSILFLLEPLFAGICVTKGKILNIVGKNKDGKVRLFCTDELPVLKNNVKKWKTSSISTRMNKRAFLTNSLPLLLRHATSRKNNGRVRARIFASKRVKNAKNTRLNFGVQPWQLGTPRRTCRERSERNSDCYARHQSR